MSLSSCLRKSGNLINKDDRLAIMSTAKNLRASGLDADEAGLQAITRQTEVVRAAIKAITGRDEPVRQLVAKPGADKPRGIGFDTTSASAAARSVSREKLNGNGAQVEIKEVDGGFDALINGERVGRLRDNLPRGAAEQLDENASVDIVKVEPEFKGQGVGSALYEAFNDKHGGRITPSGKTSKEAWTLWRRKFPEKVDAFVAAEAARIADGADQAMVIRNISDPEVARRVAEAAPESVLRSASRKFRDLDLLPIPRGALRASADSASQEFTILPGVQEVSLDDLTLQGVGAGVFDTPERRARIEGLADQIKRRKKIEPLFVGRFADGEQYLMEGQHRARALRILGYDAVPAMAVLDGRGEGAQKYITRSLPRQPSEVFGRDIAPLAIKAYKSLSPRAKGIIDGWNVNWHVGQGRLRNSDDFDEVLKAYEPVRNKLRKSYGDFVPAYRGEALRDKESGDDRFLFSWTPVRDVATGFAINRWRGMPTEITQAQVDDQIANYRKSGIARLNGYKFARKDPGKYTPDGPDYYYIYQRGEMQTDGDDISEALQSEKYERDEWLKTLRESGKVYTANIPVDSIAFIPVGANLRQPEFVAEYNPRKHEAREIMFSLPRAIIAGGLGSLNNDPDYTAAKGGDLDAALRLSGRAVDADLTAQLSDIDSPIVAGVLAIEASGRNAIPRAAAGVLAGRIGADRDTEIVQSSSPKRTALAGLDRIFSRPEFAGDVQADRNYILVDDTITQGGTFAAMGRHIEDGGGRVAAIVALSGKQYSATITADDATINTLREKFGDVENEFQQAAGYRFDGLTQSEARYLANYKPADAVRARILEEAGQGVGRQDRGAPGEEVTRSAGRQTETPEFKRWFGDSKVVDADGKPLVVYHGTTADFSEFKPSSGGALGGGIYLTNDRQMASGYGEADGGSVMPVYASIKNPYQVDASLDGDERREQRSVFMRKGSRERLIERGHDGVIMTDGGYKTVVAFHPKQVKSAIGNDGSYSASSGNITRSLARPAFFSQLQRSIEAVPDRLATMAAPQWKLWLDANAPKLGVKKDEIEWSGVKDYLTLRGKDKVGRDELVAYLGDNGVRIEETVLGSTGLRDTGEMYVGEANDYGDEWAVFTEDGSIIGGTYESEGAAEQAMDEMNSEGKPTKYGSYTVPGGENYREVLIALPGEKTSFEDWAKSAGYSPREIEEGGDKLRKDFEQRAAGGMKDTNKGYKSSHWDQPNILAHIRVDDRLDAEGKKILFINELQSDFGQDYKKAKDAIRDAVDADFQGIVDRMKKAGVLEVVCD